ncbi:alpha/beta fold hydrolase [Nonomuraea sp. NPDC050404]|uniref:alpha/beta fold hydrolase n=1 Tax=Nonomuraea sp. NPDC050404 TaxID=3155783 RepID=UPI0033C559DA
MASLAGLAGRVVTGAGVLALSPVAGLAALAGTATVVPEPTAFAVAGLSVFASVFFLGLLLCVPRPGVAWGRWLRAAVVLGVEAAVVWHVSAATLDPAPPPDGPAKVAGQREWRLSTGSRLAYVRVAPKRVTRPDPVVFLHGGPGVADLEGDSAFYGRLASAGFPVYVYDQLGAGRSARLADPRGYGLDRDVADLEAIRLAVRAERLNLVARGHGAQLAAAYLAEHPDRVARAVLLSPAGLSPGRAANRPVASAVLVGPDGLPAPRTLAVSTLLEVDPVIAHAFAGDRELDAHLTRALRRPPAPCRAPLGGSGGARADNGPGASGTLGPGAGPDGSGTHGPGTGPDGSGGAGADAEAGGYGGYAALTERVVSASLRAELTRVAVPVLVVKGACDTQSWSEAVGYRRALPDAGLAYVGGATTALGRDNAHLEVLRAFLTGAQVDTQANDTPPPGYRGPVQNS